MPKLTDYNKRIQAMVKQAEDERMQRMFGLTAEMMEEPEEHDPVEAGREMRHEQMCEAIANLAAVIRQGSEAQVKAIEGNVTQIPTGLATDKGVERALKALSKVLDMALRERPQDGSQAVLERLAGLVEENQRLQARLVEVLSESAEEEDEEAETPIMFQIQRDTNGYMTSVIARPCCEEPEMESAVTIN